MDNETWVHLGDRLHAKLCHTNHSWAHGGFPCSEALEVCYDWLTSAGPHVGGEAIANDARVGRR